MTAVLELTRSTLQRKKWSRESYEHRVETFYSWGVERYADFHNGYLNFGLWKDGVNDYVAAADTLVHRMGELLGLHHESLLLDIGCGMGSQDIYLYNTFGPRRIDALDVTWKHIEHGRRRSREAKCEHAVQFHHGTAINIPFRDKSFTHLMSIEGAEHCNTRERFMREAYRVLKPGGVIALADFILKRPPQTFYEKMVVQCARIFWQVPSENVYLADGYREKMVGAGFREIEIQGVGDLTIPGYYREQARPETVRETIRIRGLTGAYLGNLFDFVVYQAHKLGLLEYILVRAVK
jgi:ubiquinone/menaquinone biosynthesis C-methylase UbiE